MDIPMLLRGVLPAVTANLTHGTENASAAGNFHMDNLLPMLGLRSFMPMYGLVGGWLGLDPTFLLTVFGVVWAFNKIARQVYGTLYGVVHEHLMSSIHISSTDDMYMHLMRWLAQQPKMVNSRALTAETVSKTAWEDEDDANVSRDKSGIYLNFSHQEARAVRGSPSFSYVFALLTTPQPPRFIPAVGLHSFWWQGTYYRLHRKQESVFDDGAQTGFSTFKDREDLVMSCLGRSPEPIKALLKHVKVQYYNNHHARTIVKRPSPQNLRRYGGRHCWQQVADRPIRDMKTVVLDGHQKIQVLADINEYLHPATPRWYANRGIPLRRGYLFHGPPGTGKTSLSFALAGVFGLDIYVISLLEPTLTEEDLGALFSSLPRRCVVLLEDIDSAGLRRPAAPENEDDKTKKDGPGSEGEKETTKDWKVSDLAKALKKESGNDDKKGISLSGLLNAIDGVASHEGRVLIMTTNVPESLDEALIRPGRVDLQVGFTHATQEQARELFIRMYEADPDRRPQAVSGLDQTTDAMSLGKAAVLNDLDIAVEELPAVAERFAAKIPDGKFSPAEIQGYLLKRKKLPHKALEEADQWVQAMLQQKASKSKVLKMQ